MALALVTGASSGIGLELAREFAQHDYDLVIAADDERIQAAATDLSQYGTTVTPVHVDLGTVEGVEKLYQETVSGDEPLTAAALNAGAGVGGGFVDSDLSANLSVVDLNVRSTVHLAGLILPDMVARNEGKVLFTSSLVAMVPGPYQAIYNASKSFIQSFAEALRDELRKTGITVTALMPGLTDTAFFARSGQADTTRLGRTSVKDDPANVARDGFEALMAGRRKVAAESPITKVGALIGRVLPDSIKAAANRFIAVPLDRG